MLLILAARLPSDTEILDQATEAESAVDLTERSPPMRRSGSQPTCASSRSSSRSRSTWSTSSTRARAAISSTGLRALRRKLALELGIVIPLVRTARQHGAPVAYVHDFAFTE